MRPIASIKVSSNNIDEQIQEALEATVYVPRKTYKELALRFSVKPSNISAIRFKLLKLNS